MVQVGGGASHHPHGFYNLVLGLPLLVQLDDCIIQLGHLCLAVLYCWSQFVGAKGVFLVMEGVLVVAEV